MQHSRFLYYTFLVVTVNFLTQGAGVFVPETLMEEEINYAEMVMAMIF